MSTTATLGRTTLYGVAAVVLMGTVAWFVAAGVGVDVVPLLEFYSVALGALGLGGGAATVGYGLRHVGSGAPTSAMLAARPPAEPGE